MVTKHAPHSKLKDKPPLKPLIIPQGKHPITEERIDKDALLVMKTLNDAGYSSYLVGGGVRDLFLDKKPKDFDIGTNARPQQIRQLFPNSNTIGRRFRLVQIFFNKQKVIEVATLRSLSEHDLDGPETVLAPNNTFGTLDQDAQRRDLTINSLFYEIKNGTVIDYVGGVDDLTNSIIRIVGDPIKRINRDPVRMIRAIRHASRNNFTVEPKSWKAICQAHEKLPLCPPSRLRDELYKDLYGGWSQKWYKLALDSHIFLELLPLYKKILHKEDSQNIPYISRLTDIFAVIDRTNTTLVENGLSRPRDYFLLALVLLPWAEHRFQLGYQQPKGSERFHISRKIREALDTEIGPQLNLRKSVRQEIVTLLINLPSFRQFNQHGSWPKWLRRKSYFKKCSLFYFYSREAYEKKQIPMKMLENNSRKKEDRKQGGKRNQGYRGKPAFSRKSKGGVFGFKK